MDYQAMVENARHSFHQQQAQDPYHMPQSCDPVYQDPYFNYPNYRHQFQYPTQQSFPYYSSDYSVGMNTGVSYQQILSQTENLQPPGISSLPEAARIGGNTSNQHIGLHSDQQISQPAPHDLNPAAAAAAAAFSQLQHFACSMDAAERAAIMKGRNQRLLSGIGYQHMCMSAHTGHRLGGPPVTRPAYRGGGNRRRGMPSKDGRTSHVSPALVSDSAASHSRRRSRGRGGGGRSFSQPVLAVDGSDSVPDASGVLAKEASGRKKGLAVSVVPSKPIRQVSWCELCMVDCNSLEILQQHLSGKRHKKNLLRLQELEKHKKMIAEMELFEGSASVPQAKQPQFERKSFSFDHLEILIGQQQHNLPAERQVQMAESHQDQSLTEHDINKQPLMEQGNEQQKQLLQESSEQQLAREQLGQHQEELLKAQQQNESQSVQDSAFPTSGVVEAKDQYNTSADAAVALIADGIAANQQSALGQSDAPKASKNDGSSGLPKEAMSGCGHRDDKKRAIKQGKMKFVHGAKRMKMSEGVGALSKKQKEEPKFCSLCNVTCFTQAVFDCHLAGKKHTSKVKRIQGLQGSCGSKTCYDLQPQSAIPAPKGHQRPIFQGDKGVELLNQPRDSVLEVALHAQAAISAKTLQEHGTIILGEGHGACSAGSEQTINTDLAADNVFLDQACLVGNKQTINTGVAVDNASGSSNP